MPGGPNSRSGLQRDLAVLDRTGVAAHDADDGLAAHGLGDELLGRSGDERESAADFVRRVAHEVAVERQQIRCHVRRVQEHAAEHDRAERVHAQVEAR